MSGGITADRETAPPSLCLANLDLVLVPTLRSLGLLHFHRIIEGHFGGGGLPGNHI